MHPNTPSPSTEQKHSRSFTWSKQLGHHLEVVMGLQEPQCRAALAETTELLPSGWQLQLPSPPS